MLVVQGNDVPDSHRALIMAPAWENGYIGKFYKHCFCFCTGCNYTILVSSKSEGYINIGGKTSGDYVDLKTYPGGEIYDAVPWWGVNCYNYSVSDKDKDFSVKLQAYTGNPDIYVNPLVPLTSKNFSKATYNNKEHFWNEELVLEPSMREEQGGATGPFFICVWGNNYSSYKLTAKNEDHSNMLKAGLSESSYIDHDEVKLFYYTDQVLMDEKIKLKYDVPVMTGVVRAKAKLCPLPSDMSKLAKECFITKDELMEEDPNQKLMQHAASGELIPDHNVCFPNTVIQS
jgi:hypothetical protein